MIDWASVAQPFAAVRYYEWRERAYNSTDIRERLAAHHTSYTWDGNQIDNVARDCAVALDNLGRALAGAGMLATVEKRAHRIAFERMEEHLRSGWHLGAELMKQGLCMHCGERTCRKGCPGAPW